MTLLDICLHFVPQARDVLRALVAALDVCEFTPGEAALVVTLACVPPKRLSAAEAWADKNA